MSATDHPGGTVAAGPDKPVTAQLPVHKPSLNNAAVRVLLAWSGVLAVLAGLAWAVGAAFAGVSPLVTVPTGAALATVLWVVFTECAAPRGGWDRGEPDHAALPRVVAHQARQYGERLDSLLAGSPQDLAAVLRDARACAAALGERAEAVAAIGERAGAVPARELRAHHDRLAREAAAAPPGPLRSARRAAARDTAAWGDWRERWEAAEGTLLPALDAASGRLREVQRAAAAQLKRRAGNQPGTPPDVAPLAADLAAARADLDRIDGLTPGFVPPPAAGTAGRTHRATSLLSGLLALAVLLFALAAQIGPWMLHTSMILAIPVGLAAAGAARRAPRRSGALLRTAPAVAACATCAVVALTGPLAYHQLLGDRTAALVTAREKADGTRYDFGTHYSVEERSGGEDLGRMWTGPNEAVHAGAELDVSADPLDWARPVADERLGLAWAWAAVTGAGLVVLAGGLALTAAGESREARARSARP
ncbi:hypothetical protein [Streptomyces sp. MP131-18]|uniref:hypothetical protein n=1 Tax=Streptomyces sp. MP131-18 TaxID=1857892 RepID=UPI00117D985D|nr:hypothetical protein [Streptomyces sp. MP131-18]